MIKRIYNWFLSAYQFKPANYYVVLAGVFICLAVSMLYGSRSFTLGYAVAICFIILYAKSRQPVMRTRLWILIIFLTVFMIALFVKSDSSLGRLLVYKITFNLFKDHWVNGVGLGRFKLTYLYYQEAYFKAGNFTQKELLLADNTQHAFNDYWQFILETGIKGIVILATAILVIVNLIHKAIRNNPGKPGLLFFAIAQLMAISIAALFTHVFELFIFQAVFISAFFIVAANTNRTKSKVFAGFGLMGMLLLAYLHWGFYLKNYTNYQKMEQAHNLYQAGYITESLNNYRQLYGALNNDPLYLAQYAEVLSAYGNSFEAESIIKLAIAKQCNDMYYNQLAQYYYKNGKLKEAEQAYLTAVYMVPNRFTFRYNLFLFYSETDQAAKAIQNGKEIIALPIKIRSPGIDIIKSNVIKQLTKY